MDANDRSTSSLNDPMPGTRAADAAAVTREDALRGDLERRTALQTEAAADVRQPGHNPGDEIGEAVGGISGVLTGAALGSLGGPIGTVIGGIAGAVSGWWAGRAISEAASHATDEDDGYFRGEYEQAIERRVGANPPSDAVVHAGDPALADAPGRTPGGYDAVRPAYQLGHLAGRNPDYQGRSFDDVEGDLRHGWNDDVSRAHGAWESVRDHVRTAYDRSQANYVGSGASVGSQVGGGMSALGAGATYVAGRSGFGDAAQAGGADAARDRP